MLGMRVILQEDDDAHERFYALTTDRAEQQIRKIVLLEHRRVMNEIMAESIKDANGGPSLHQAQLEAQHRVHCAPIPGSKMSDPHGDGAETVIVRVRCMFPEIRHIEDGAVPDVAEDELVSCSNRSKASYLQDLTGPATVPIDFTWTLLRTPGARAPRWQVYPGVFTTNLTIAGLALSPCSMPGGVENYLNPNAAGMHADHGLGWAPDPRYSESLPDEEDQSLPAFKRYREWINQEQHFESH